MAAFRRNVDPRGIIPSYGPADPVGADEFARRFWDPWTPIDSTLAPHTDMYEEDGNLVIETELPGMKVGDIEVKLEGDRLTMRAEKKEESKKDARHHTRERYYGEYYRTFTLPFHVREDEVKARYQDGILEVVLPRSKKDQTRKVEIKGPPEKEQVAQEAKKANQIRKA